MIRNNNNFNLDELIAKLASKLATVPTHATRNEMLTKFFATNGITILKDKNMISDLVNQKVEQMSPNSSKKTSKQSDDKIIYKQVPNENSGFGSDSSIGLKVHKERKSVLGPIKKLKH